MLLHAEHTDDQALSGKAAERAGDWNDALSQYEAALLQASEAGDFPRAVQLLRAIGRLHFERGDYNRAVELFRVSLAQAEAAGDTLQTAKALNCLGVVEQFRGRVQAAQDMYTLAAK